MNSQLGFVRVLTCITALWSIWEHRNEIYHDECKLNPVGVLLKIRNKVLLKIRNKVREVASQFQPKILDNKIEQLMLEAAGIDIKIPTVKKGN